MEVIYKYDNKDVDFNRVALILEKAFSGRKFLDVDRIKESFLNSSHVVYAYIDNLVSNPEFKSFVMDNVKAISTNKITLEKDLNKSKQTQQCMPF